MISCPLHRINTASIHSGKERPAGSFLARTCAGPIVDKFFMLGAVSGIFGTAYLGIHLWLMRTGQIEPWITYHQAKYLHALVQNSLFFGLFILGFIFQAGPKLLEVEGRTSPAALICAISPIIGVVCKFLLPTWHLAEVLVAAPFLAASLFIASLARRADFSRRMFLALPLIVGALVMAAVPLMPMADPAIGLFALWGGIAPVILGAGQQFISGFLGGAKVGTARGGIFLASYLCSLIVLCFWLFDYAQSSLLWRLFGVLSLICLVSYLHAVDIRRVFANLKFEPLALSFFAGYFWALFGAAAISSGYSSADDVLHLWAAGWAVTITMALSAKVIGFLSGGAILSERKLILLLLVWQAVPLGRGASWIVGSAYSWVVALAASIVFAVWGGALVLGAAKVSARQFAWHEREVIVK